MITKNMYAIPTQLVAAMCNAIRVAALQYEEDARLAEKNAAGLNEGPLRIAAQFRLQAKQCRELFDILDDGANGRVFVEFLRSSFTPDAEDAPW